MHARVRVSLQVVGQKQKRDRVGGEEGGLGMGGARTELLERCS